MTDKQLTKQEKREAEAREADRNHRNTILDEALNGFIAGGMNECSSKKALDLINIGAIPHVTLNY